MNHWLMHSFTAPVVALLETLPRQSADAAAGEALETDAASLVITSV